MLRTERHGGPVRGVVPAQGSAWPAAQICAVAAADGRAGDNPEAREMRAVIWPQSGQGAPSLRYLRKRCHRARALGSQLPAQGQQAVAAALLAGPRLQPQEPMSSDSMRAGLEVQQSAAACRPASLEIARGADRWRLHPSALPRRPSQRPLLAFKCSAVEARLVTDCSAPSRLASCRRSGFVQIDWAHGCPSIRPAGQTG